MSINKDMQIVAKSLYEVCKDEKQEWISKKIAKLIKEGKLQDQAVAIAYSMWDQK